MPIPDHTTALLSTNSTLDGSTETFEFISSPPDNFETRGPLLIVFATVLCGLSIVVVGLRLVTRRFILRSFGWDDWCILISLILATGYSTCVVLLVMVGDTGKHTWMVKEDLLTKVIFNTKVSYAGTILQNVAIALLRASICLFLIRLHPSRKILITLRVLLFFVVAIGLSNTLVTAIRCPPLTSRTAEEISPSKVKRDHCLDPNIQSYLQPSLNLALNVAIYVVPIPLVCQLELTKRQKIGLIVALQLGSVGIAGVVLQITSSSIFLKSTDPFWDTGPILLWLLIELYAMMIGSSLPIIKALYIHIFHPLRAHTRSHPSHSLTELDDTLPPSKHTSTHLSTTYRISLRAHSALKIRFSLPYPPKSPLPPTHLDSPPHSPSPTSSTTSLPPPPHTSTSNLCPPPPSPSPPLKRPPPTLTSLTTSLTPTHPPPPPRRAPPPIQTFDPDFFVPTPPASPMPGEELKVPAGSEAFTYSPTSPLPEIDAEGNVLSRDSGDLGVREGMVRGGFRYGGTEPLPAE